MPRNFKKQLPVLLFLLVTPHVNPQTAKDIRSRMQSFVDNRTIPGAVTLVIKKDHVLSFEAALSRMLLNGGVYKGRRILSRLIRIFLEQVFGGGNESQIFMAMAAAHY